MLKLTQVHAILVEGVATGAGGGIGELKKFWGWSSKKFYGR